MPPEAMQAPPLVLDVTIRGRTTQQRIQGEALIGRPDLTRGVRPELDLRLDDAVSRRHAKIFVRDEKYVLTDLNSTNGTRYNGEWLVPENEVVLKAGDEIEIGEQSVLRVIEAP
jgi:pSer/pThr/pTyr-binding forkhead associated (FHA) protein